MMDRLEPGYPFSQDEKQLALADIKKKFLEGCTPHAMNYGYVLRKPSQDPQTWWAEIDYSRQFYYNPVTT